LLLKLNLKKNIEMMRRGLLLASLFFYMLNSFGQEQKVFIFKNDLADTSKVEVDYMLVKKHFLGSEIAKKLYIIKKTYTYIEKGSPTSPGDKTIVRKPVIYYSLNKLNRYYKKQLKKDRMEESVARERYNDVLNKAFSIFDQNTDDFEEYLKGLKDPADIEELFHNIILD